MAGTTTLALLAALAFFLFYALAIRTDIYGDARTILFWDANDSRRLTGDWLGRVFSFNLQSDKEALTLLLHRWVARLFHWPIGHTYRILSSIAGAMSLLLWALYVRRQFKGSRWAPLLLVAGCLIGSNQLFFGHVETYPLASLASMAFLLAGSLALEGGIYLWIAPIAWFAATRIHPALVYFLPALLFVFAHRFVSRRVTIRPMPDGKLAMLLAIPFLVAGGIAYFFYFKSYNEPHSGAGRDFAHSFLPIIAGPPPFERYSLQSLNHLGDFLNVLLLIGAPVVVALVGIGIFGRKAIGWHQARIPFAALALGFSLVFFFALNPALSMPRDWDLYALLGPPLLLFLTAILAGSDTRVPSDRVFGMILGFGVFTAASFALNAAPGPLSARLERTGEHVYRSYYAGSSYIINVAQGMERDTTRAIARRIATIERLAPPRTPDPEYAHLMSRVADLFKSRDDLPEAARWMERAVAVSPADDNQALWLSDYYLRTGRTSDAWQRINKILGRDPRNVQALILGAIASAQTKDFTSALRYLERAKALAPQNPQIDEWIAGVRKSLDKPKS